MNLNLKQTLSMNAYNKYICNECGHEWESEDTGRPPVDCVECGELNVQPLDAEGLTWVTGYEFAEVCIQEDEVLEPKNLYSRGLEDIPEGDYCWLRSHGVDDPDTLTYWQGFNKCLEGNDYRRRESDED